MKCHVHYRQWHPICKSRATIDEHVYTAAVFASSIATKIFMCIIDIQNYIDDQILQLSDVFESK